MNTCDKSDEHLIRYITNRNARTGETWRVVERYFTNSNGQRVTDDDGQRWYWYLRAIIVNEHGERIRIWYRDNYWTVAA